MLRITPASDDTVNEKDRECGNWPWSTSLPARGIEMIVFGKPVFVSGQMMLRVNWS